MYKHPPLDVLHMADVVEDTTKIANIMGAYTFLTCYRQFDRQFESWSKNEPTLTLNNGKYVGYEAVKGFFVDYNNEQTKWANEVMRGLYPEELGGKSDEEIWAVGSNTVLTMTSPIIEVAFDGQTAKGLWYVFGETTEVYSKGPKAAWNFGKCAVDFIKEDGQWKIWRVVEAPDIIVTPGDAVANQSVFWEEGANLMENLFGTPTLPMTAHDPTFNWSDDFPHAPKAYYTYDPKNGCCPEGVLNAWRPY